MGLLNSVKNFVDNVPIIGRALKKAPLVGGIVTAACEIPDLIKGFQNGDGASQLGRSLTKVGIGVAGIALATLPVAWPIAAALVIGSGLIADPIADGIFGKSIEKQKEEVNEMAKQDIMNINNNVGPIPAFGSSPYMNPMFQNPMLTQPMVPSPIYSQPMSYNQLMAPIGF